MDTYEHRQFSPWPLATLAFVATARAVRRAKGKDRQRGAIPGTIGLALLTMQFSVLTTRVDSSGVSWCFGLGFPSGHIEHDDIADAELTKTSVWEGYGIHWTSRRGWLWNAYGRDAVKIRKGSGTCITLGSDDATGLLEAIRSFKR